MDAIFVAITGVLIAAAWCWHFYDEETKRPESIRSQTFIKLGLALLVFYSLFKIIEYTLKFANR